MGNHKPVLYMNNSNDINAFSEETYVRRHGNMKGENLNDLTNCTNSIKKALRNFLIKKRKHVK